MYDVVKPMLLAGLIGLGTTGTAFAADDDVPRPKPVKCENGQIWDKKTKACVTSESNLLDDDAKFEAARSFAYAGQFQHALTALSAMDQQNTAKTRNLLGYTNRKLGNSKLAMMHYVAALELDPNYLLARSYMGQALANEGKFDEARAQLHEISKRGGRESWAYVSLKQHLRGKASY